MRRFDDLVRPSPLGLYCPPGDFYIDPVRPVKRAVITHGHSDHARAGHGAVLATQETLAIMGARYGQHFARSQHALGYGRTLALGDVDIQLAPAGHVLGSAQVAIRQNGVTIVASGDYKRRRDPTCAPFEPVSCAVFITEATFALPIFRHPDDRGEVGKLLGSLTQFPARAHIIGVYALGKAQRIIALLRQAGWERAIYLHPALTEMCAIYTSFGVELGRLASVDDRTDGLAGEIVLAPPAAAHDGFARRFADPLMAFASGWLGVRGHAKQRGCELPLVISDHADWDELTTTIAEIAPQEVWINHGRADALLRWAALTGVCAKRLENAGYGEESD